MMQNEPTRTPRGLKGGELSQPVESGLPGLTGGRVIALPRSVRANTAGGDKFNTAAAIKLTPPAQKRQKRIIFAKNQFFHVVPAELRS